MNSTVNGYSGAVEGSEVTGALALGLGLALAGGEAADKGQRIDFFSFIPDELMLLIVSYLPPASPSTALLSTSCSRCCRICSDAILWMHHVSNTFPHLSKSIFVVKCYIDSVILACPSDVLESPQVVGLRWMDDPRRLSLSIPQRESKKFFAYLHKISGFFSKCGRISFLVELGLAISDFSLLRWALSISGFSHYPESGCTLKQMEEISKAFPEQFPSVCISESRGLSIPECAQYAVIVGDGYVPTDLSFENIGEGSNNNIQGVEMYDVPEPMMIRCLSSLRLGSLLSLNLSTTQFRLPSVRTSFGHPKMSSVTHLRLRNYPADYESVFTLSRLKSLHLAMFPLAELPSSIGALSNLQKLTIVSSFSLIALPDSIGNLGNLRCLDLRYLPNLENLPDSINDLGNLQELTVTDCEKLTNISRIID